MGKNNKKSKARQLLSNPMTNSISNPEKKPVEELQKMLRSKLSDLYSNIQVSSSEVISELSESEKTNLFQMPRKERTNQLKKYKNNKKNEIKSSKTLLPDKFKNALTLGLKKCLKGLENKSLQALIYDSTVNIEALKCLFDKGDIPMIPIPEVSNLVREITGFPALCLGFTKEIVKDVDLENHFQSILDLCKSFHPGFAVKSKEIIKTEGIKKEMIIKNDGNNVKSEANDVTENISKDLKKKSKKKKKVIGVKVTLLKRSSKNERVFDPTAINVENNCDDKNNPDAKVKEEKEFSGDFISFSSKPIKRKKDVSSNILYKKTKMELM